MWKIVVVTSYLLLASPAVLADAGGVSFTRNRMVYHEGEKAISIAVQNHGSAPYLIQTGISVRDGNSDPAPFLVTPPLFRLEGNTQNMMRIVRISGQLPQDRESLFYYYATAIPGQQHAPEGQVTGNDNKGSVGAQLSIAMKTVLKLFYRPRNLTMTIDQAHHMMRFVQKGENIIINNPTPYYQSFAHMKFDGIAQDLDKNLSMVAPMSHLLFPAGKRHVHKITWSVMTDYGGVTDVVTQNVLPN
ncbi:molecular chaperone [Enterobacteriaceae bacterium LUAb1]